MKNPKASVKSIAAVLCTMLLFAQCGEPNKVKEAPTQSFQDFTKSPVAYIGRSGTEQAPILRGERKNGQKSARVDQNTGLIYSFYPSTWQECTGADGETNVVVMVQNPTNQPINAVKLMFRAQNNMTATPVGGSGGTFTQITYSDPNADTHYEWDLGTMDPYAYYVRQIKTNFKPTAGVEGVVYLYQTSPYMDTQVSFCDGTWHNLVWNKTTPCGVFPDPYTGCP